jgi:RNA polymerase sigma-70 factor (ECF subfamily)
MPPATPLTVDAVAPDIDTQLVALMDEFERPLYNFLLSIVQDADVAVDCAQDTFLRAYKNLQKGKGVNAAWLYTVARNRAMDEFRRKKHIDPNSDELERLPVRHSTDRALAVQEVMAALSPADREVLYLFDVAGFQTDEIGDMLGIRGSAVRQRLSRARARFRHLYGENE